MSIFRTTLVGFVTFFSLCGYADQAAFSLDGLHSQAVICAFDENRDSGAIVDVLRAEHYWFCLQNVDIEDHFKSLCEDTERHIKVLRKAGDFVGFVMYEFCPLLVTNKGKELVACECFVDYLGVKEEFKGFRFGETLLNEVFAEAEQMHTVKEVCLGVRKDNNRALALYTRLGFVKDPYNDSWCYRLKKDMSKALDVNKIIEVKVFENLDFSEKLKALNVIPTHDNTVKPA